MELYRKRLIPDEIVKLQDTVLRQDDEIIITKWEVIRPRPDFDHGCSCYFLKEGYKVSRFLRSDGSLKCWYCDIITYERTGEGGYIFIDLLADVIIEADGRVRVVDLDELADASQSGLITPEQLNMALRQLNALLEKIYSGELDKCQAMLEGI